MKEKKSQPASFPALELTEAATLAPLEVLSRLASSSEGLSGTEVDHRVREFGANVLDLSSEGLSGTEVDHRVREFGANVLAVHRVRASVVLRSEEHTSELQSLRHLVCRLL